MKDLATQQQTIRQGEIVMYQPDETIRLEVRLENDTVWLNRQQLAQLFGRDVKTIGKHITNALKEELRNVSTVAKFAIVQMEGNREVTRTIEFYNLDMVISVGYRVKSEKGIEFRIWANKVIKEYLLHGYAVNQQLMRMEQRFDEKLDAQQNRIRMIESTLSDHQEKINFFVRTNQPPVEGVLFEGQIFDAYKLVEALIKSAKREIILIDNYIDATIFDLLEKRGCNYIYRTCWSVVATFAATLPAAIWTKYRGEGVQQPFPRPFSYSRRSSLSFWSVVQGSW